MILANGFYIAELKHPSHRKQRLVVEVQHKNFLSNRFFDNQPIDGGLDNCYKLLAKIDLNNPFSAPIRM